MGSSGVLSPTALGPLGSPVDVPLWGRVATEAPGGAATPAAPAGPAPDSSPAAMATAVRSGEAATPRRAKGGCGGYGLQGPQPLEQKIPSWDVILARPAEALVQERKVLMWLEIEETWQT